MTRTLKMKIFEILSVQFERNRVFKCLGRILESNFCSKNLIVG
jgi:hypothetical protein